jgi:ABC-2 type transport system permease protein
MNGLAVFFKKEMLETVRTWRAWVLPAILLFMGIASPLMAKLMSQLLESMAKQQPGMLLKLAPPTYSDAYMQWLKNLTQIVLWAVIIVAGGTVSGEKRSGTAVLVLTKPLSRTAFVLAKAAAAAVLLLVATAIGGVVCWGGTLALFGTAPAAPFFAATGIWLIFALTLTSVTILLSTLVDSPIGAAGIGLGVYAVFSLSALWSPLLRYGVVGLLAASSDFLTGKQPELLWPLLAGVALATVSLVGATAAVSRREI